jgi:polyphenol oxidase
VTLPVLVSARLRDAGFSHGFSTREGGVSEPPYETLDFAILRDPSRLRENQRRLAEAVGVDAARLHQARQVHGSVLLTADGDPAGMLVREADALVAEPGSGHAVMVRVADCVPVLLGDPASGRVAAVHAGWRGVEAGVVAVTVRRLVSSPAAGEVNGLLAAIGPCIGACCFEVGCDVAERIASASASGVVVRRTEDKAYVELRAAVRAQLGALGLADAAVDDVPGTGREGCTRCDASRFYSYRRDGDASGRLAAVIVAR